MTPTQWKRPRTGDKLLRVQFRNGLVSRWTYTASQLRWTDTGADFDVVAVDHADKIQAGSTWSPVSGGY